MKTKNSVSGHGCAMPEPEMCCTECLRIIVSGEPVVMLIDEYGNQLFRHQEQCVVKE
jgi:hypothetical protein